MCLPTCCIVVLFSISIPLAEPHPWYRNEIPNGYNVPDPCWTNRTWPGVGHMNEAGGGDRNPFGLDFSTNEFTWGLALCRLDSDGDGRTNGQELGDPDCLWSTKNQTTLSSNLSHPGVCEPVESPSCSLKNSWLVCVPEFNCSAFNSPGVEMFPVQFPLSAVPAQTTTYKCLAFKLPSNETYQLIGYKPLIGNINVIHHMILYGCLHGVQGYSTTMPWDCEMANEGCPDIIGGWTMGIDGQCFADEFGLLMGNSGYQLTILQVHWNNVQLRSDYTDHSGLLLYYTSNPRPNNGRIAVVGQSYLDIPSGQSEVVFSGRCSSKCTRTFPRPIYLVSVLFHMHLIGKSGNITLYRNGSVVSELVNVLEYDFNRQQIITFDSPIVMEPYDEIAINCVYSSLDRNCSTRYGPATTDEMCFGFIMYYPALDDFEMCNQWKNYSNCAPEMPCQMSGPDGFQNVSHVLLTTPDCTSNCKQNCADFGQKLLATGCLSSEMARFVVGETYLTEEQMNMVLSCVGLPNVVVYPPKTYLPAEDDIVEKSTIASIQSTQRTTMMPTGSAVMERGCSVIFGIIMFGFVLIKTSF